MLYHSPTSTGKWCIPFSDQKDASSTTWTLLVSSAWVWDTSMRLITMVLFNVTLWAPQRSLGHVARFYRLLWCSDKFTIWTDQRLLDLGKLRPSWKKGHSNRVPLKDMNWSLPFFNCPLLPDCSEVSIPSAQTLVSSGKHNKEANEHCFLRT